MIDLHQALLHVRAGRWKDAHELVQREDPSSPMTAWLHGILHIQEGDLANAQYWYDKANRDFRGRATLDEELLRFERELGC